jgi:hypothetical protein
MQGCGRLRVPLQTLTSWLFIRLLLFLRLLILLLPFSIVPPRVRVPRNPQLFRRLFLAALFAATQREGDFPDAIFSVLLSPVRSIRPFIPQLGLLFP